MMRFVGKFVRGLQRPWASVLTFGLFCFCLFGPAGRQGFTTQGFTSGIHAIAGETVVYEQLTGFDSYDAFAFRGTLPKNPRHYFLFLTDVTEKGVLWPTSRVRSFRLDRAGLMLSPDGKGEWSYHPLSQPDFRQQVAQDLAATLDQLVDAALITRAQATHVLNSQDWHDRDVLWGGVVANTLLFLSPLMFFFSLGWVLDAPSLDDVRPQQELVCIGCGYDLHDTSMDAYDMLCCPECGKAGVLPNRCRPEWLRDAAITLPREFFCSSCGYDLQGTRSEPSTDSQDRRTCPECGRVSVFTAPRFEVHDDNYQ